MAPGWRWESLGRVEVGVPGTWAYGVAGRQWCTRPRAEKPFVGRPGAVTAVGCGPGRPSSSPGPGRAPDPGTLVATGGTFVWLRSEEQMRVADRPAHEGTLTDPVQAGDRDTFTVDGVRVDVQAPAAVRERIRATVRVVDRDHNGCDVTAPFAGKSRWRPNGPPVGALRRVSSVSACRYSGGRLFSSVRVDGEKAAAAVAAIAAAPVGGGPDAPKGSCVADEPDAEDRIVLRVRSASGTSRIVLRYEGCFDRGLDDGTTVRALTRPAVAPFVVDGNRVTAWVGENLTRILGY